MKIVGCKSSAAIDAILPFRNYSLIRYHGQGFATMDNQATYDGLFENGMMHGKGIFTWPNGVFFDGDFEFGKVI